MQPFFFTVALGVLYLIDGGKQGTEAHSQNCKKTTISGVISVCQHGTTQLPLDGIT